MIWLYILAAFTAGTAFGAIATIQLMNLLLLEKGFPSPPRVPTTAEFKKEKD